MIRSKHRRTATCLLETVFLTLAGKYFAGDQRDLTGDIQKAEADDNELPEEDADDDSEGKENFEMEVLDGVASSFGDFSRKGSLGGVLNRLHTVFSRKPISRVAPPSRIE